MQFTIEEEEVLQNLGLRLRKVRILRGDKQKIACCTNWDFNDYYWSC
jgi:hypothetical protein